MLIVPQHAYWKTKEVDTAFSNELAIQIPVNRVHCNSKSKIHISQATYILNVRTTNKQQVTGMYAEPQIMWHIHVLNY